MQKRKERESAIQKTGNLTAEQKRKWLAMMKNEYMSLEESGEEDTIMVVHPSYDMLFTFQLLTLMIR